MIVRGAKPLRKIRRKRALRRVVEFDRAQKMDATFLEKFVQIASVFRRRSQFFDDEPFVNEHEQFDRTAITAFGTDENFVDFDLGKLPVTAPNGLLSQDAELAKRDFDRSGFGEHVGRMSFYIGLTVARKDHGGRIVSPNSAHASIAVWIHSLALSSEGSSSHARLIT